MVLHTESIDKYNAFKEEYTNENIGLTVIDTPSQ